MHTEANFSHHGKVEEVSADRIGMSKVVVFSYAGEIGRFIQGGHSRACLGNITDLRLRSVG